MDALAVLKRDHRAVETLFKRFERAGQKAQRTKKKLVKEIVKELSLHADIEEQVFYPAVQKATGQDRPVLKAMEEHDLAKTLLQQLERMEPDEERFDAKVAVLIQNVREHVREEESDLFPAIRSAVTPAQLRELGVRLEEGKAAIQSPKDYLRLG